MSHEKIDKRLASHSLFKRSAGKNTEPRKTIIIELYSDSDYMPEELTHELNSNTEISYSLRAQTKQKQRFIYALDKKIQSAIVNTQKSYGYSCELVYLDDNNSLKAFLDILNPGDSLLIIAQSCNREHLIAGLDADAYIEWITEDLELADKHLDTIELFSCNMGCAEHYIDELRNGLSSVCDRIIAYKTLCAAGEQGKVFIKESKSEADGDLFYDESNLDNELKVIQRLSPCGNVSRRSMY
ncbi:hypothetical protein [Legionella bononiensis]|uniref:Uncharacterized protein n=1 Tax=Legionella bononiensis TaxID=2793102 RepID=A0ABS1WF90_9GAMM|nr:hypothetical protein [Legionella bononiensis]MBL7479260.1 hypothetical protein [Legionella bononiensis]MBL7528012.1 hypothetical protein [Legionella bononiensis]MBL7563911.1 hypothetical protein [Legionella bononiensis]